ncbi:Adenylate and Guanylate cyclase catalytic domain containing protein [Trichomonas vaginalis G3]|uniref:Adenylate and Guanylate cyclase catalytic domain containing protein n=1 Tax=Trichomonas vaginalis (strain ATCC PRA-98 / G3) TaxID=412133 RepID=A2G426_TRIV3|nr:guanylate cyclase protein [Trichomonas vaginalis G3]EAX88091.1 Adenylate and Guanylate cyclase catalytic domain containing protein [Trichomonas vaginalis G3]KAI5495771.1 guanylate cyclase protein [Trichomonas vaginalis G3]|eukprot:XP_001301021.1 Adenylate and Guanylate cyclase catalytic domain containing protein [Trichomonas vaginalis G3]
MKLNSNAAKFYQWFGISTARMIIASELGNTAIQMILLNGSLENTQISYDELVQRTHILLFAMQETNGILMNGNNETDKMIGYNDELDSFQIHETCIYEQNPDSVHDMYACASLNNQINMFIQIIKDVMNQPKKYKGELINEFSMNLLHMLESHIYPNIYQVSEKLKEIIINDYNTKSNACLAYLIVGLVVIVMFLFASLSYRSLLNENYTELLVLIQHLSPQAIIDSKELMDFLRRENGSKSNERMSISKSIVYGASESIIITNHNGTVEIINPSLTDNLGFKPDQVLGQHIQNFLATSSQQKVLSQIELMMNGQGSSIWQDHIELINDSGKVVPFMVSMIGMKDSDTSSTIDSIVFILSNETEEIKQREQAEIAKQKSEKLLYQILPKDIVIRLNRGEKDISFTIPQATVFFIDIVKFSNYTASLSPSEIMANLSTVFATFDRIVSGYELITKIKLIGDVYMAASGLFITETDEKTNHAEQAVRCCLDIANEMDSINAKLESHLEVRIGVNSGGPLIGGVLGTDKPTFDIIGDTINVAARLQSIDIPGKVQISKETKELIQDLDLVFEERGEVFLKGKGNRTTYFVRYPSANNGNESFAINMFSGQLN